MATPALAQQPLTPAPVIRPTASSPCKSLASKQAQPQQQPMDPYAQYGDVGDDEDEGLRRQLRHLDVAATMQQYDDGYDPNAYQQFESTLSPYGSWQDVPSYGHVWVPSTTAVGYDFYAVRVGRPLGHDRLRLDLGQRLGLGLGAVPLRPLDGRRRLWLVLDAGHALGPGVGALALGRRLRRLGADGPARRGHRRRRAACARRGASPSPISSARVRPHFLPSRAVASVWHSHDADPQRLDGERARHATCASTPGPSSHLIASATGRAIAPTPLRSVAPRALPNQAITPRIGTPVQSRPWMQNRAVGGQTFARAPQPLYSRPPVTIQHPGAQPIYRAPQSVYRAPQSVAIARRSRCYRAPQSVYRAPAPQAYRAPQPIYRSPTPVQSYHPAPQYHYSAPVQSYHPAPQYHYSAPMQSYHPAPQYHYSAPSQSFHPSYSAPSSFHSSPAPSFHGGGGGGFRSTGGFHGGGGRR